MLFYCWSTVYDAAARIILGFCLMFAGVVKSIYFVICISGVCKHLFLLKESFLFVLEQEGASSTSSQVRLVEGAAASASAEQTASDAQHLLQSMAGNRKTE